MQYPRSPFPGMDPYLETRWGDVHTRLCAGIGAAVQQQLPSGLRAAAEEEVFVEADEELGQRVRKRYRPDVTFAETSYRISPAGTVAAAAAVLPEPLTVQYIEEDDRERWVEIIDTRNGNRLVTVIEILSPSNKRSGPLNTRYREKVAHFWKAGVNIVEIDLLRSSRWNLKVQWDDLPADRYAEYLTCINRAGDPDRWECYPMPLRLPLPTIPIPCRKTDADVSLALQPLLDQIYFEGGHYDIDYSKPPPVPFVDKDAEWALELLRSRATAD